MLERHPNLQRPKTARLLEAIFTKPRQVANTAGNSIGSKAGTRLNAERIATASRTSAKSASTGI
jgi:hypothetical protein